MTLPARSCLDQGRKTEDGDSDYLHSRESQPLSARRRDDPSFFDESDGQQVQGNQYSGGGGKHATGLVGDVGGRPGERSRALGASSKGTENGRRDSDVA